MTINRTKKLSRRVALLVLAALLMLPSLALAGDKGQGKGRGKGRGKGKPTGVFVNGHDARDGRTDGRGPRRDRNRRDDDDDDDRFERRRRDRRDRDRDDDGINDRTEIRRQALSVGYNDGLREGREDRANGEGRNYSDESEYQDATRGYRDHYGDIELYRRSYQEGFRRGYEDGYQGRTGTGRSRVGDILGDILGRP